MEYVKLCEIEHKKLKEYYDMESFVNYLINAEKGNDLRIFTNIELKIYELILKGNKIISMCKNDI